MIEIPLGHGHATVIDEASYELVRSWKWKRHKSGYACRNTRINGKDVTIWMHRLILQVPEGLEVDHIDGNPLNNLLSNLRQATHSQNMQNKRRGKQPKNRSGLKGVVTGVNFFYARIRVEGETIRLGRFVTAKAANKAYLEAVEKYHGEFANVS